MCPKTQGWLYIVNVVSLFLTTLPPILLAVKPYSSHSYLKPKQQQPIVEESLELEKGNGYYYTTVSTPNYPNEFETPFTKFYVLNLTSFDGFGLNTSAFIYFYFTEFFLGENTAKVFGSYDPEIYKIVDKFTKRILIQDEEGAEMEVSIPNFRDHLRTKLHFHNYFGFNISIEVSRERRPAEISCSIHKCSYAGTCKSYPGKNGLEFKCECLKGYYGTHCEYGPKCDPQRNINFCSSGTCRMFGSAGGNCECFEGFGGGMCQYKIKTRNFIEENHDCSPFNSIEVSDRPCSLCNTFPNKPAPWRRYLILDYGRSLVPRFSQNPHQAWNFSEVLTRNFEAHQVTTQTVISYLHERIKSYIDILEVYGILKPKPVFPSGMEVTLAIPGDNTRYPGLKPRIFMNKEKEKPLSTGMEFSLRCLIKLPSGTPPWMIEFKWFKDQVLIRQQFSSRNKHIVQFQDRDRDGNAWSVLMVDDVSPIDMGVWTCQVTDLLSKVQECSDYSLTVVVPPQIETFPMSLTMMEGDSQILMCSDGLEDLTSGSHQGLHIEWFKGRDPIDANDAAFSIENIFPQGQLLRIHRPTESATFTCIAKNKGGMDEMSVEVKVLDKSSSPHNYCLRTCEQVETTGSQLLWGKTSVNQTAKIKCPEGFYGYVQKLCYMGPRGEGKWDASDFSRCAHEKLGEFNTTLQRMKTGYNVPSDGLNSLHKELQSYLETRKVNQTLGYYKLLNGEGDKFILTLRDTFTYLEHLKQKSLGLVTEDHVIGLLNVTDDFLMFSNSCAHFTAIDQLLQGLQSFIQEFPIEDGFEGDNQNIITETRYFETYGSNESSPIQIEGTTTSITFDCAWISDNSENATHFITYMQLSGLWSLNEHFPLISDVVQVSITDTKDTLCIEEAQFQIVFQLADTSAKNRTCKGFYHSEWKEAAGCLINSTLTNTTCICKYPGTYAVFALPEQEYVASEPAELVQLPPDWIATSGCVVCLVLSLRTLVCGLLRRIYQPYFIISSTGLIMSSLFLLSIVQGCDSHEIDFMYMLVTLAMQCVKIWQMVGVCDMKEFCLWFDYVSEWMLLAAICLVEVLPLFVVFLMDCFQIKSGSILDQNSAVFVTFSVLLAMSILVIFILYYKSYLRVYKKDAASNNHYGDQNTSTDIFVSMVFHVSQVFCVLLFLNMRQQIFFHYILGIFTCILGMHSTIPRRSQAGKKRNNASNEAVSPSSANGLSTIVPALTTPKPFHNRVERQPLTDRPVPNTSNAIPRAVLRKKSYDDEDLPEFTAIETSANGVAVTSSSHTGIAHLKPYAGAWPKRGECQLSLGDVVVSTK